MPTSVLTAQTLRVAGALDTGTWQSVINLLASRSRAFATSLVLQAGTLDMVDREAYLTVMKMELVSTPCNPCTFYSL
jgi:hypothetical protein